MHVKRLVLGLDVVSSQSPGPVRGISAPPREGLISPSRSSLDTLAPGVGATVVTVRFTIEAVDLADGAFVVAGEDCGGVDVVVVDGDVVVVVIGVCTRVVATFALSVTRWSLAGITLFDVVSVKTRTSSKRGLDHINKWVLLNEKRGFDMVLEG